MTIAEQLVIDVPVGQFRSCDDDLLVDMIEAEEPEMFGFGGGRVLYRFSDGSGIIMDNIGWGLVSPCTGV